MKTEFHVRTQNDIDTRIPQYWDSLSKPLFLDGKINPVISEIVFDVPDTKPNIDTKKTKDKFFDLSKDGRIHIFFVDSIYEDNQRTSYNGVYQYRSMCNSFILIQDNTRVKTIAHEIGHYLGIDHTIGDESNIMNKGDRTMQARFNSEQLAIMRKNIRNQRIFCNMPKRAN